MAGHHGPGAGEDAGEGGLAGGAGAEDAEHVAGIETEGEALEHGRVAARRAGDGILDPQGAADRRQWHLGYGRGRAGEGFRQRRPVFTGGDDGAPLADDLLQRRDRAAHQDGGGDHRAGGRFALDHQPGADAEDGGLQEEAEGLGAGREAGEDAPGAGESGIAAVEHTLPAAADSFAHAQGLQDFGIARHLGGAQGAGALELFALLRQARGGALVEGGGGDEDDRAEDGPEAEQRVEHEQHDQEERAERGIEHGAGDGAGDEAAELAQVADRAIGGAPRIGEALGHGGGGGAGAEQAFEIGGGNAEQAGACPFEYAERAVEDEDENGEGDEGRDRLRGEDAVIDLQHVERAGQHQEVHEQAETADMPEHPARGAQGAGEFAGRGFGGGVPFHGH